MDKTHCPICNSERTIRNFSGENYLRLRNYQRLYFCDFCSHSWRTPLIENDIELNNRYELERGLVSYGNYTANLEGACPAHLASRIRAIRKGQSILDFGSGDGTFLDYARSEGLDAWGVDPHKVSIASHLKDFVRPDINAFGSRKFDYVHANHVLEHVASPIDSLKSIAAHLSQNGILFVEVPNELLSLTSFAKRVLGKKSNSATSLYEHQHYFSPKSLREALITSGYIVGLLDTPRRSSAGLRCGFDLLAAVFNRGRVIYAEARAGDVSSSETRTSRK